MEQLDDLTDNEVRSKLAEFGYPVGPVTATTRKYLIKKLGNLIEESKGSKVTRRSKFGLSSAEESESENEHVGRSRKTRSSMPPPSSFQSRRSLSSVNSSLNASFNNFNTVKQLPIGQPFARTREHGSPPFVRLSKLDIDSGSDSDVRDNSISSRRSLNRSVGGYKRDGFASSLTSTPRASFLSSKTSTPRSAVILAPSVKKETRPFFSNLTRRFVRRANELNPQDIKETDVDEGPACTTGAPYTYRGLQATSRPFYDRVQSIDSRGWRQHLLQYGPMLLLSIFLLFVVWVVATYSLGVYQTRPLVTGKQNNVYPLCKDRQIGSVPCIPSEDLSFAVGLYRDVHQLLLSRATQSVCGPKLEDGSVVKPYMSSRELIHYLLKSRPAYVSLIENGVKHLGLLLLANPHWGISLTREDADQLPTAFCNLPDELKAVPSDLHDSVLFITPCPIISWTCRLRLMTYTLAYYFSFLLTGAGLAYIIFATVRYYMRVSQEEEEHVMQLVDAIWRHVTESCTGDIEFIPVRHVHDALIQPVNRPKMARIWDRAVDFIEKHESRIRQEVQRTVWGEDAVVWRPLTSATAVATPPPPSTSPPAESENHLYPDLANASIREGQRVWQGEAFETSEGSMNSLPASPTPCLKIRHMFQANRDYGPDWEVAVKDAIMEKCEGARILHIHVDSRSKEGCVYVKCVSSQDAGIAFRRLHGSWFDGALVTVKYLRLERYHERYPDAVNARIPLSPSNNLKLSLGGSQP